jgi:hypothetical protein
MNLLLVLAWVQTIAGPTGVVSSSWAMCDDAEPADLRSDAPLIVLSEPGPYESDPRRPLLTAFALYANGKLITRRGVEMIESHLSDKEVDKVWRELAADKLFEQEQQIDRITDRQSAIAASRTHCFPPETELHLWKEGCHRELRVRGLSLLALAKALRATSLPIARADAREAQSVFTTLPPVLGKAMRAMLTSRGRRGKVWCRLATCFSAGRELPYHELWDGEDRLTGRRSGRASPAAYRHDR